MMPYSYDKHLGIFYMHYTLVDTQTDGTGFVTRIHGTAWTTTHVEGREIAQWLASLSVKPALQVQARHDPLVSERWNSISVLLTFSHQY